MLQKGSAVRLHGLSEKNASLNGQLGSVHSFDARLSRWKVRVNGKLLALHEVNLLPAGEQVKDGSCERAEGMAPDAAYATHMTSSDGCHQSLPPPKPSVQEPPPCQPAKEIEEKALHARPPSMAAETLTPKKRQRSGGGRGQAGSRAGSCGAPGEGVTAEAAGNRNESKRSSESDWDFLLRVGDRAGRELPSSVGARGLPPGALARGLGGVEVRSLDGVLPLPSHESVGAAMRKLARGEEQAATAAVRHDDVASIRSFCRVWHEVWGVVVPPSLLGGAELSPTARRRISDARKKAARNAPLPGRLTVVSGGTSTREDGSPHVPPSLLDVEFADGAALHAAMSADCEPGCELAPVVTYSMVTCADPCWVPAPVMRQRIVAAGEAARPGLVCVLRWSGVPSGGVSGGAATRLRVSYLPFEQGMLRPLGMPRGGANDGETGGAEGGGALETVEWMEEGTQENVEEEGEVWSLVEGATRGAPSVLICASRALVLPGGNDSNNDSNSLAAEPEAAAGAAEMDGADGTAAGGAASPAAGDSLGLLPPLSQESRSVKLPASILQKSIRRSSALCSPMPLLRATAALLGAGRTESPPRGGARACCWTM